MMSYYTHVTLNKDVFSIIKSYLDPNEKHYLNGEWDKIYNLTSWAAARNKLDVFQTLLLNGDYIGNEKTVCMAACYGHVEIMKFIRDHTNCLWDEYTYNFAVNPNSNIKTLEYMKENKCPWDSYTYINAIKNDKFDFFKWLHVNGCPWNYNTCIIAANLGKLKFLKYARENGCFWNGDVLIYAQQGGHWDCVEYCEENNCPIVLNIVKK